MSGAVLVSMDTMRLEVPYKPDAGGWFIAGILSAVTFCSVSGLCEKPEVK